jgi:chemotaxis protein MotB
MAGRGKGGRDRGTTIVVRREEAGEHGHHGGAWKVAYADFVTAMMAFFLLMWLLNATSEEQRRGLADYFAPSNVLARANSGSGQPFSGRTLNADGDLVSDNGAVRVERGPVPPRMDIEDEGEAPPIPDWAEAHPIPPEPGGAAAQADPAPPDPAQISDAALRAEHHRREAAAFEQAAEEIREMVREDPALSDLARQLVVEQVPEGLRIQILDAERQPMFPVGGAAPNERARALLAKVAQAATRLPNGLAIAGHTDATPFRGGGERSNWELSAERANAVRRLLLDGGIAESRLRSVTGHAERQPLLPDQPQAAANRRVAITLLREALAPAPPGGAAAP